MTREKLKKYCLDNAAFLKASDHDLDRGGAWAYNDIADKIDELNALLPTVDLRGNGVDVVDYLSIKGICSDTTIGVEGDYKLSELLTEFAAQQKSEMSTRQIAGGKVLMYGNIIVDSIMLPDGIYGTKLPRIYPPDETIEHMIETSKMFRDKTGTEWLPDSYFDNLAKCELREVAVVFSEQQSKMPTERPKVVTICGSGRFLKEMHEVEERLTLEGVIVLMIGVNTKDVARTEELAHYKPMLDELHLRKIDMSDEVFVVDPGGYIGESTSKEISYAKSKGKPIQYLSGFATK